MASHRVSLRATIRANWRVKAYERLCQQRDWLTVTIAVAYHARAIDRVMRGIGEIANARR